MENDTTREYRHTLDPAVAEYRELTNEKPEDEKEIIREVSDKHDVTQKDLRERAEAGV